MGKTLKNVKFNPRNPNSTTVNISSDFGIRTITLNGKKTTRMHNGVDLTDGTKIYAIEQGTITAVRKTIKGKDTKNSAGNYIKIKHPNSATSVYYHLKYGSLKVKVGDKVTRGQYIADEGSTGNVTGPHLHLGIYVSGKWVDPKPYLLGIKKLTNDISIPKTGIYTITSDRNVYADSSNKSTRLLVKSLTVNGKAHATSKKANDKATLKKGTKVTVSKFVKNDEGHIWAKIPSGWICLISNDETKHYK